MDLGSALKGNASAVLRQDKHGDDLSDRRKQRLWKCQCFILLLASRVTSLNFFVYIFCCSFSHTYLPYLKAMHQGFLVCLSNSVGLVNKIWPEWKSVRNFHGPTVPKSTMFSNLHHCSLDKNCDCYTWYQKVFVRWAKIRQPVNKEYLTIVSFWSRLAKCHCRMTNGDISLNEISYMRG